MPPKLDDRNLPPIQVNPPSPPSRPVVVGDFTADTKYNQAQYEVEIWLNNSGGESTNKKIKINPNAIINLTINDTLANWVTQGSLTFYYTPNSEESILNRAFGQTALPGLGIYIGGNYVFRNDGLDLLRVRIVPKTDVSNNTGISIDSAFWTISHLFSVYDMEDIDLPSGQQNAASNRVKCLKLYFWDSWYQRLSTRVIEYSTGLSNAKEEDKNLDNGEGVLKTGIALREIIETGLSETGVQNDIGASPIDNSIGGLFDEFKYPPIGPDWDEGAANIFYTAPTFTTAYDSMMYVYNKHISNDSPIAAPQLSSSNPSQQESQTPSNNQLYDFCILIKEKGPNEKSVGQLCLKSMGSFFKKAGKGQNAPLEYQIEHFFLQESYAGDTDSTNKELRAPILNSFSDKIDIKNLGYNQITNYRFVDIAGEINSKEFCNRPIYSFDNRNRTMNIEFGNNSVLTARKFIADKYINEVYKKGSNNERLFLPVLEKEKEDRIFQPVFSPDGDNPLIRPHLGLQKLLKIGVFENAAVNFRALGQSFRGVGRFIAIDKTDGVAYGEYEDKFFGQWFIIDIKHIFESEIYYNEITAVKIHRFQEGNYYPSWSII